VKTVPLLPLGAFTLRPLRPGDSQAWFDYLRDPRTTEHTSWPEVSAVMIAGNVDRLIAEYGSGISLRWALARVSDDVLVGTCGFTRIDRERAVAELAYDLAPAYWGCGIMGAAVDAAVAWGLTRGGLSRIEALVMDTNLRSIALLERHGFTREQLLANYRLARGVPRDFWLYAKS